MSLWKHGKSNHRECFAAALISTMIQPISRDWPLSQLNQTISLVNTNSSSSFQSPSHFSQQENDEKVSKKRTERRHQVNLILTLLFSDKPPMILRNLIGGEGEGLR